MTEVRKAIWYSILNQYFLQVIGFVSVAILARLLTPQEIGVFAVATSIAFLATSIRSLGVGEYLIREKNISNDKVKSVIGVMIIISWGLAFVLIGSAPWIAEYYKVGDLKEIIWIMAVPFFLAPYTSIPYALLARDLHFHSIFRVDLAGGLVRVSFSIGLVLLGYSYFGLAYGALFGVIAEFLMITYIRPTYMTWIPTLKGFKRIFKAGIIISISKTLNTTSLSSSDLVLGRLAQMSDVGLYSRGLGLILFLQNLLIHAVGPTALPHLSQVKRSGGSVSEAYLNAIALIGAFTLPLFAVVNIAAYHMITALFGDQWTESVNVASILAIWGMLHSVHCFFNPALLVIEKERLVLFKETISISIKVTLMIIAVPHGLDWVAWSFVVSGTIDLIMVSLLMKIAHGISLTQLLKTYFPNIIVAASCWITLKLMFFYIDFKSFNSWFALIIIGLTMIPVWLVSLKLSGNRAWPIVSEIILKFVKFPLNRKGIK